jgi:hypothetical protein
VSYYAAILLPDGPDIVHYCFSLHEAHAASAAVRVANRLECDVCVVDDRTDKITQVIRFRPDMLLKSDAVTKAPEEKVERHYLSNTFCNDTEMRLFIAEYIVQGYTVTITPSRDIPPSNFLTPLVNLVATKHRR